jgi:6-phosphogluconolactonase (cycloisomerase 2 family)
MKLKGFPLIAAALVLIASTASLRAEFLYVSYGNGLLSFSINRDTGALTALPGTPTLFADGTGPLALDRSGRLLYVSIGQNIHGYRIASNGQLVALPGSPYSVAGGFLAVDPFNRFLYSASGSTIAAYRIEPNGSLSAVPGSPFPAGGDSASIAVDPFGRFVCITNYSSKNISVFSVLGNGVLRPVSGSPFATGKDGVSVVAEFTGRFVYVASDLDIAITTYKVAGNGVLTQVSPPAPPDEPWCEQLGYNPVGGYLYLLRDTSGFWSYHLNPLTGLPEGIGSGDVGYSQDQNNPVGVAVTPNGKFVYEGNSNSLVDRYPMTLRGFKVGPTGALTLVPGSPYYPLGTGDGKFTEHPDPVDAKTLGWPSSMLVAP